MTRAFYLKHNGELVQILALNNDSLRQEKRPTRHLTCHRHTAGRWQWFLLLR
ncbi:MULTISPECIES: hypothetical protein [unclassified Crossiella]|uniref:hypothetical protein n=1 Tax=unclassified Crossiella TaxID=2620835 RepID=UPI001FFFDF1F|nr:MULTISPECIES: hypothetical protein [unclassified Crossiella]MCK2240017.1 hypothetical protein [Crossiella sp. S99.2]MCK2252725.1 hypothetical protein [Crossiella sp. S99.1]